MAHQTGVKRPLMYFIVAAFSIAIALPLAISSGQTQVGGLFDECYGDHCETAPTLATLNDGK